jgi:uncharacterized protein (TIGR00255 family)
MNTKDMDLYSMTGFGRGSANGRRFRVTVELRSVNSRFLELRLKLPRPLASLEAELRMRLEKALKRGMVDLNASVQPLDSSLSVSIDETVAEAYARGAEKLAGEFDVPNGLTAIALLRLPGVVAAGDSTFEKSDEEEVAESLREAVDQALTALVAMRKSEGGRLGKVVQRELAEVKSHKEKVRRQREDLNERQRARIEKRVSEWLGKGRSNLDETRLYQEIAYYLDRSDVTEELDRLASHLKQCEEVLQDPGPKSAGKRLEFLVQELGREVNTIGAKSDQVQLTNHVLEMKLTLEKIREQVQNLE